MNKAILMGRLTRDPELKQTTSGIFTSSFTLAIDRRHKSASGERQADFVNVVAWRQQAEFCSKYFHKGSRMLVVGSIQTRSYTDKDGNKRNATEVVADEISFVDSKTDHSGYAPEQLPAGSASSFTPPDGYDVDTSLPFDL